MTFLGASSIVGLTVGVLPVATDGINHIEQNVMCIRFRAGFRLSGALFWKYVGPFPALIPLSSCPIAV